MRKSFPKMALTSKKIERLEERRLFTTYSMTDVATPTTITVPRDYTQQQQTAILSYTVNTTFNASQNDSNNSLKSIQLTMDVAGGTVVSWNSPGLTTSNGLTFSANGNIGSSYSITENVTWPNSSLGVKTTSLKGTIATQSTSKDISAPATQRVIMPAGSLDLSGVTSSDKHTNGGFIAVNSDDDNNDGKPDYTNAYTPGEDDLVPLTLHASGVGGDYQLEFNDSGTAQAIKVWAKSDKSAADGSDNIVSATSGPTYRIGSDKTIIDASKDTTLYVEGVGASSGLAADGIKLEWKDNPTNAPYNLADEIKLTVYSVTVKSIDFDGPNNVNIRIDATTDIGDGSGGANDVEWINGTRDKPNTTTAWTTSQAAPAAFISSSPMQADVAVTVSPNIFSSVSIKGKGSGAYGDFTSQSVSLSNGAGHATFTSSQDDIVSAVDQDDISFQWHVDSATLTSNKVVTSTQDIEKSTNRIYSLAAKPVGSTTEPWAAELELATGLANQGADAVDILTNLTNGIYFSKWKSFGTSAHFINPTSTHVYNTGVSRLTREYTGAESALAAYKISNFDMSDFISAVQGTVVYQECTDNAALLGILANVLGVDATMVVVSGNADETTPLITGSYVGAGDTAVQTAQSFDFHSFVEYNGNVFDASIARAGGGGALLPACDEVEANYMNATFPPQGGFLQNYVSQEVSILKQH